MNLVHKGSNHLGMGVGLPIPKLIWNPRSTILRETDWASIYPRIVGPGGPNIRDPRYPATLAPIVQYSCGLLHIGPGVLY